MQFTLNPQCKLILTAQVVCILLLGWYESVKAQTSTQLKAQSQSQNTRLKPKPKAKPSACLGLGEPNPLEKAMSKNKEDSCEKQEEETSSQQMNQQPNQSAQKTSRPVSQRGALNVLGTPLKMCCADPLTGYERDGFCHTGAHDRGKHTVCAIMTQAFLEFTKSRGNDLSTAYPQYNFPGLKPGDRWCLCASRWAEAEKAGYAPLVDLEASQQKTLDYVSFDILKKYSIKDLSLIKDSSKGSAK